MFRIKICGITNVDDAKVAVASGADAIGLNFFAKSPRYASPQMAAEIVAAVRGQISVVGVFVNAPVDEVIELADRLPLDYVQLHGDEPPATLRDLAPRRVVRAFRLRSNDEQAVFEYVESARALAAPPVALLIDAFKQGRFGGTGALAEWGQVGRVRSLVRDCPIVLAGGLCPDNVRAAVQRSECDGVDVASGVEVQPGKKDVAKTYQFVELARAALREIAE